MIRQLIFAFIATFCFATVFNIRGKKLLFTSIGGVITWGINLSLQGIGWSESTSYFVAALMLTLFSEVGARALKTPVTSILICGLMPLVPGGGMYYTMYYLIQRDSVNAFEKGLTTLFDAGALAFGIIGMTSLVRVYKGIKRKEIKIR